MQVQLKGGSLDMCACHDTWSSARDSRRWRYWLLHMLECGFRRALGELRDTLTMSEGGSGWIDWNENPKWIGTALAILILLLKSLITYLWGRWQDGRKPQPPSKPGKASPGEALNQSPVLASLSIAQARPDQGPKRGIKLSLQVLAPKKVSETKASTACGCTPGLDNAQPPCIKTQRLPGKVLYGTQKGTAANFAKQLVRQAATFGVELHAVDLKDYEVEQLWKEHLVLLVLSTYENGSPPDSARCAISSKPWLSGALLSWPVGLCLTKHLLCGHYIQCMTCSMHSPTHHNNKALAKHELTYLPTSNAAVPFLP